MQLLYLTLLKEKRYRQASGQGKRAFVEGTEANTTSEITQWKPTFYIPAVILSWFEKAITVFLSDSHMGLFL